MWKLSLFTLKLPAEVKKIEIFPKFQRWMKKTNMPREVLFIIRNRVPYNKLLTNRACSGCTGEYWPSVVFVRTSLRSVRTVTTSGQYSPVRPSRSVSKRLVILHFLRFIPFFFLILYFWNLIFKCIYYMANPVVGKSLCSDWFFLG